MTLGEKRALAGLVVGLALCLPLAACASSSAGSAGGAGAPKQLALADVPLQTSDLPAGWTGKPANNSADGSGLDAKMRKCVGVHKAADHPVHTANSDTFDSGAGEISSDAQAYKTQAEVDADVALMKNPKVGNCFRQGFAQALAAHLPAGARLGHTAFTVTPGSAGQPVNVAGTASGRFTLVGAAKTVTLYFDVAYIAGNKIESDVEFLGAGQPVDPTLRRQLIAKIANRTAQV